MERREKGWYNSYTIFNTFGGATQILSMMLLFPLLRKLLSAIQVFYVSCVMAAGGYLVLLVLAFTNMSNVFLLFIPGFLIFAANGMLTVLTTIFFSCSIKSIFLRRNIWSKIDIVNSLFLSFFLKYL